MGGLKCYGHLIFNSLHEVKHVYALHIYEECTIVLCTVHKNFMLMDNTRVVDFISLLVIILTLL